VNNSLTDHSPITAPALEPVTLSEAKLHVRVDGSTEDALITALIVAARQLVEEQSGLALITQTWEIRLDAWPALLYLPRAPLLGVTSVTYTDDAALTATLAATAYTLRTGTQPGSLLFDADLLPTVTLADVAGVKVRYTAGYGAAAANVPQAIRQAILLLVGHWYANREAVGAGTLAPLPMAVDALLAPYRNWWFGEWVQ
jgi:uncharacterized phiE125 gp8 family phage protein